ncbi:hypothetical protein KSF_002390 [Reticulibacter mediterranei]|uniref:Uncharacterized protein n=1 Tax=Reticulibacter mediterranei TaxID=2778369 RepID=A0A8J3I946_9CHLR|nr:hypothetical protein KSF_002390 [Reticulibacter mediterranei]
MFDVEMQKKHLSNLPKAAQRSEVAESVVPKKGAMMRLARTLMSRAGKRRANHS